jgi:integrase
MASIFRRLGSPFWYCEYLGASGKWVKKSTKLRDKAEALKWCLGLQHAQDAMSRGSPAEAQLRSIIDHTMRSITGGGVAVPTVRQWLEQWLQSKEGANAPRTLTRYKEAVSAFLAFLGPVADGKLSMITQEHVISVRRQLRERGKSPATINLTLRVITIPLRQAARRGLIAHNPLADISPLIERGQKSKGTFTPQQVRDLLSVATPDWRGAILCAYSTGGRITDVANLQWPDVDVDNGVLSFVQSKTQTRIVVGLHADFRAWLDAQKVHATGPLFPSLAGRRTDGWGGLSAQFGRLMDRAGIPTSKIRERQGGGRSVRELSFHSFRHGAASAIFKSKLIEQAQKHVTGHARGDTLKRYTHHDLDAIKAASLMIPRLF